MITNEIIENNKSTFISLIKSISRESANIDGLIKKLEGSDFFTAPATTKYHGAYSGGLCDHCLSVYYNLISMINSKHLSDSIPKESALIVALLHDFYKMNFYETSYRNKKEYKETGSKRDENGYFDWVSEKSYVVIPNEERFLYGSGGETSEYMVRCYIPLKLEESVAIIHANAGLDKKSNTEDISSAVFERYPLACLLHLADMMASYIDRV